ncbi:hypothetical protein Gogos_021037, partial [Gossypium gossypioides]|nr:hypothetical protein [Gossypium gossypioides]
EKKDVKLVLGNEEGLKDDINYELCLVGKFLGEWVTPGTVDEEEEFALAMWESFDVSFSYKCLSLICYLCGTIDYSISNRPKLLDLSEGPVVYE